MVLFGKRQNGGEKTVYRFYRDGREVCVVDCLRFGDLRTVMLRQTGNPMPALCATFDGEETLYKGAERTVVDVETGEVTATLCLSDWSKTTINDRYLIAGDDRLLKIWDSRKPTEPIALLHLKLMADPWLWDKTDRLALFCDDDLDPQMRLTLLMLPAVRFA